MFGGRGDPHFVGLLFGDQHFDRAPPARRLALAHGLDALLRFDRLRAGRFGLGLRRRLLARFAVDFDGAFHAGGLDRGFAGDFELPQFALAQDAGLVDAALGGDARPLDFFAGGDLGFLQRLGAGNLELLHRAPAFEPGNVERLFAHDIGALHVLGGDDIGFLDPAIGVGAFGELGRDFDRAVLLGDLDDLAALDIENLARLRRLDALALERKLGRDARRLDGLAPLDLGVFDRLFAGDIARLGFLFGGDALGGEPLLLRDAAGFDRFARRNFGSIDRAIAGDLERTHFFVARDSLGGELAVFGNADRTRRAGAR